MRRVTVLLWLVLALVVGVHWVGEAQQPPAPAPTIRASPASRCRWKGKDLTVARRRFEPGARSAWHSHDKGQLLMVEEGRMRTQKRGQAVKELGVGESDYTGPNMVHWHGARQARRWCRSTSASAARRSGWRRSPTPSTGR